MQIENDIGNISVLSDFLVMGTQGSYYSTRFQTYTQMSLCDQLSLSDSISDWYIRYYSRECELASISLKTLLGPMTKGSQHAMYTSLYGQDCCRHGRDRPRRSIVCPFQFQAELCPHI